MPIVEALCLNDAYDSATCWYYTKGQMYTIDTDSEIARMTVRPMSSGKMNKDGEIVPAKLLRPPLPVFQFDHAVPLTVSGKPNDYTCKKCGATKDPLGRPFTLNTLGTHTNSVHREVEAVEEVEEEDLDLSDRTCFVCSPPKVLKSKNGLRLHCDKSHPNRVPSESQAETTVPA